MVPHGTRPCDTLISPPRLHILNRPGFLFASVCIANIRKGTDVLLNAFLSEFSVEEDVGLLIRAGVPEVISSINQWIADNRRRCAKVLLYSEGLHEDCILPFYSAADAYVVASRGEGFGLTYLEALALGIPVIATNWGGHLDFLCDKNSYLVAAEHAKAVPNSYDVEGQPLMWAEPDPCALRSALRHVYLHHDEARARAKVGQSQVLNQWTWERAAQTALQHLSDLF